MSDLKTLEEKYRALGEEIKRLKNNPVEGFWKPANGGRFLYKTGGYKVFENTNDNTDIDHLRIDGANCYRPEEKELAEKDAARDRARQIIQRTADQLHDGRHYFEATNVNYAVDIQCNKFRVMNWDVTNTGAIYFRTRSLAEQCLELCRKEYEILLGIR